MNKKTTHDILLDIFKKPTIKASEAGKLFDLSSKSVNNKISLGEFNIPTFKVGRHRFVRVEDLASYIDEQARKGNAENKALRLLLGKKV
jgi:hypothetical protein